MKITTDEISKIQDELSQIYVNVSARKISDQHLIWHCDGVRVAETVKDGSKINTNFVRGSNDSRRVSIPSRSRPRSTSWRE